MERTSCDCRLCQIGCRTMPGVCGLGDVDRILELVGGVVEDWFEASLGGCKFLRVSDGPAAVVTMALHHLITIVPRRTERTGECVFFRDGRCDVHQVSPAGCRYVDPHMPAAEANERVEAILHPVIADAQRQGPYYQLSSALLLSGRVAEPLEQRKSAYRLEEHLLRLAGLV